MNDNSFLIWFCVLLVIFIGYVVWVGRLHYKEKVVFFYSYFDFAVCSVISILNIFSLMFILGNPEYAKLGKMLIFLTDIAVFAFLFNVIYKANDRIISSTLIVFLGQIVLSISFIIIWILSFGVAIFFRRRNKYERVASYNTKVRNHFWTALFFAVLMLSELLCKNADFSLPKFKNG